MSDFPDPVHLTLSGANQPGGANSTPISLAVHELAPVRSEDGRPPVVFCHGFPDLAHAWRHQLPAVADAGFRAIAPNQRGYDGSSAPDAITDYGLGQLCGDLADLLDELDIERAVFIGHDWGGFVAWAMPVLFPERCVGAVGVCTPYTAFPSTEFLKMMFGEDPEQMYMLWFQEPGVAEAKMDPQARLLFEKVMKCGVDPARIAELGMAREGGSNFNPFIDLDGLPAIGEPFLSEQDLEVYASTFERTGFRGPINWYRNIDANGIAYPAVGSQHLDLPTLMICAEWDPALPPALAAGMPALCSDLEMHTIDRAGHWVQQEYPEQVNSLLVDWLSRRFPA